MVVVDTTVSLALLSFLPNSFCAVHTYSPAELLDTLWMIRSPRSGLWPRLGSLAGGRKRYLLIKLVTKLAHSEQGNTE